MLDIFSGLRLVIKRRHTNIDNAIFRCHWFLTSTILVSFSLIITARQYVGQPIECHSTNRIPDSLLNSYCWVQSTFTIPQACNENLLIGSDVPYPCIDNSARGKGEIKVFAYYQWVGIVLFVQGVLFHLPYYLWKVWESGLIKAITGGLRVAVCSETERRRKRDIVVEYLYEHLGCHRKYAIKYFICELCCLLNLCLQLWATNRFFDGQFLTYGFDVLQYSSSVLVSQLPLDTANQTPSFSAQHNQLQSNISSTTNATAGRQLRNARISASSQNQRLSKPPALVDPMTYIFPRMTKCTYYDFGSSGDIQKHDALCLLPLNIVNEKIYIALWFWFAILALLTVLVILYRICAFASRSVRCKGLASRCMFSSAREISTICGACDVGDWFLLYMIAENLDPLVMREIVAAVAFRLRFATKLRSVVADAERDSNNESQLDYCLDANAKRCGEPDLRPLLPPDDAVGPIGRLAASVSCADLRTTTPTLNRARLSAREPPPARNTPIAFARQLRRRLYGRRLKSVELTPLQLSAASSSSQHSMSAASRPLQMSPAALGAFVAPSAPRISTPSSPQRGLSLAPAAGTPQLTRPPEADDCC